MYYRTSQNIINNHGCPSKSQIDQPNGPKTCWKEARDRVCYDVTTRSDSTFDNSSFDSFSSRKRLTGAVRKIFKRDIYSIYSPCNFEKSCTGADVLSEQHLKKSSLNAGVIGSSQLTSTRSEMEEYKNIQNIEAAFPDSDLKLPYHAFDHSSATLADQFSSVAVQATQSSETLVEGPLIAGEIVHTQNLPMSLDEVATGNKLLVSSLLESSLTKHKPKQLVSILHSIIVNPTELHSGEKPLHNYLFPAKDSCSVDQNNKIFAQKFNSIKMSSRTNSNPCENSLDENDMFRQESTDEDIIFSVLNLLFGVESSL